MKTPLILGLMAAAALALPTASASADAPATSAHRDCFQLTQWSGWSALDRDTLLLRMKNKDVYRADLSVGSTSILFSGNHLLLDARGTPICSAIDLTLKVDSGHGVREPLIVRTLTKLTPDEVAAIPAKDLP